MEQKKDRKLTEEMITDIDFFSEDLESFDTQLVESDKLYGEIHKIFASVTGGEYVPSRSLRDIAELGKTLVSVRSLTADIVNKRHSAKKSITDIVSKRNGGDDQASLLAETARQVVALVNQQAIEAIQQKPGSKNIVQQNVDITEDDSKILNRTINKALKQGDISLSQNDKLVGVSGHTVPRYDPKKKEFVAVDDRTGKIINGFPKERLPQGDINRTDSSGVYLISGENIKIYDPDEDFMEGDDE